jgi:hypothetical protein
MSSDARITPYRDGPILVRGGFSLTDQDGNAIPTHQRTIALCRCGRPRASRSATGRTRRSGWRGPSGPGDEDGADGGG